MLYRNFLFIIIFLLLTNCKTVKPNNYIENIFIEKNFTNRGFALIYNEKLFIDGLITRKINERSLIIFQKSLKINTHVKITNILNNKSLVAKVGKRANYPLFNNSVLSMRIAEELNLNSNEPYVEIKSLISSSSFIAKKAKTYDEEKNVATKAPVNSISIDNLLEETNNKIKKDSNEKFLYEIKIADFYFMDTAKMMSKRILEETKITNPKIKKITKERYRVYLGPFNNINSLQKSYNDISILMFENIEIIKND
tara:strand:+ start:628 stop:1389 length:762 start_codon:yes stop_codon:yes gene_type:complete